MVISEKTVTVKTGGTDPAPITYRLKDETNLCGGGWFTIEGFDDEGNKKFHFQNKSRTVVEDLYRELTDS